MITLPGVLSVSRLESTNSMPLLTALDVGGQLESGQPPVGINHTLQNTHVTVWGCSFHECGSGVGARQPSASCRCFSPACILPLCISRRSRSFCSRRPQHSQRNRNTLRIRRRLPTFRRLSDRSSSVNLLLTQMLHLKDSPGLL